MIRTSDPVESSDLKDVEREQLRRVDPLREIDLAADLLLDALKDPQRSLNDPLVPKDRMALRATGDLLGSDPITGPAAKIEKAKESQPQDQEAPKENTVEAAKGKTACGACCEKKAADPTKKPEPGPEKKPDGKLDPDPSNVIVNPDQIVILEPVNFALDKYDILPKSASILAGVGKALRNHPEIEKVRVDGHTDVRASIAYNQTLSENRVNSVINWLVDKEGIDKKRLVGKGEGELKPLIPDAKTEPEHFKNRRVEFHIVNGVVVPNPANKDPGGAPLPDLPKPADTPIPDEKTEPKPMAACGEAVKDTPPPPKVDPPVVEVPKDEPVKPEDPPTVVVKADEIVVLAPIHFKFDKWDLTAESEGILNDVATALKNHAEIKKVRIEGHTDVRGKDSYNQDLSNKRVASVVKFLVGAGIDATRLQGIGKGESEPKIKNAKTPAEHRENRRVEFKVIEGTQAAQPAKGGAADAGAAGGKKGGLAAGGGGPKVFIKAQAAYDAGPGLSAPVVAPPAQAQAPADVAPIAAPVASMTNPADVAPVDAGRDESTVEATVEEPLVTDAPVAAGSQIEPSPTDDPEKGDASSSDGPGAPDVRNLVAPEAPSAPDRETSVSDAAPVAPGGPESPQTANRPVEARAKDDIKSKRKRRTTARLVGAIAPKLGVPAALVDVRLDAEASRRTAAVGAPGLLADGKIWLDPNRFDPETKAGQHVLAHEMAHIAQTQLDATGAAPARGDVEADAGQFADAFVSGGSTDGVKVPLAGDRRAAFTELDESTRKRMESSFGTDLSAVRVREDGSATAMGAEAYTAGSQITFAPGQYDPNSREGLELIGHEIGHTVQQSAGRVQADANDTLNTSPSLESEADRAGAAAASGSDASIAGVGSGVQMKASGPIQQKKGNAEQVEAELKAARDAERALWEPINGVMPQRYFESERFSFKDKGGKKVDVYLATFLSISTFQKLEPGPDGEKERSQPIKGVEDTVARMLAPILEKEARDHGSEGVLAAHDFLDKKGGFSWDTRESTLLPVYAQINDYLWDLGKNRLLMCAADLVYDADRGKNREELAAEYKKKTGSRFDEADRYFLQDGTKPPGVSDKEWKAIKAAHDKEKADKEKAQNAGKEPLAKDKPADPKATAVAFVTETFKIDADKGRNPGQEYSAIPTEVLLKGTIWTTSKNKNEQGGKPEDNLGVLSKQRIREVVGSYLPGLLKNRVKARRYLECVDEANRREMAEVAAATAQYAADEHGLLIDKVAFEVLSGKAAADAASIAETKGEMAHAAEPSAELSFALDENGNVDASLKIPMINLGGGFIIRDLEGALKVDPKTKKLVSFTGNATVVFPIKGQVWEIKGENIVIVPKVMKIETADGTKEFPYISLQSGKGSFKTLMPFELHEEKKSGRKWILEKGAAGRVEFDNGQLKSLGGDFSLLVEDREGKGLVRVAAKGVDWKKMKKGNEVDESALNFDAKVDVLSDLPFAKEMGPNGDWTAYINKDSTAHAKLEDGKLVQLSGTLDARIDEKGEPWVKFVGSGDYDHEKGTADISGTLDVVKTTLVARLPDGKGDIYLDKGTLAQAKVIKKKLTEATGALYAALYRDNKRKVELRVNGSWYPDKGVDGEGSVRLVDDFAFAIGTGEVKVLNGAEGHAVVTGGELTSLDGKATVDIKAPMGDQVAEVQVKGSGTFDFQKKVVTEAIGSAALQKPLKLGANALLEKVEGELEVKNNEVVRADGRIVASYLEGEKPLLRGGINGKWTKETNSLSGAGEIDLLQDIDVEIGGTLKAVIKKGANIKAIVAANEVTRIGGALKVELQREGKKVATLAVTKADYDVKAKSVESLVATVTLDQKLELLNGGLTISKASGTATIAKNKLVGVTVTGNLAIPAVNLPAASVTVTWSNDGTQDDYAFDLSIPKWSFFGGKGKEKDRSLSGALSLKYEKGGKFKATAGITYEMSKDFKAGGVLTFDEKLKPKVESLTFAFDAQLADKANLFDFEATIVKLFLPIFYVFQLSLGIGFSSKLDMSPITLKGAFSVNNWEPGLEEDNQIPTFEAKLDLGLGFNFEVALKATLEAALDVFVASVGIGAEAILKIIVPIAIKAGLELQGGPKGWGGAFGLQMDIQPELQAELLARLFADVVFFDEWEYELGKWTFALGKLPGIHWEDSFPFGEKQDIKPKEKAKVGQTPPKPKPTDTPKAVKNKKASDVKPPVDKGKEKGGKVKLPGGGEMSGDSLLEDQKSGTANKDGEGKKESDNQLGLIMAAANGLKAIDTFVKFIKECAAYIFDNGPAGIPMLLWDVYKGKIDFKKLKVAWAEFQKGVKAAGKLMKGMSQDKFSFTARLGGWLAGDIDLLQLLFGADEEVVKAVKEKQHLDPKMKAEGFASMLRVLGSGTNKCGPDEQWAVWELLKAAAAKGCLQESMVGISGTFWGADQVLYKMEGDFDTLTRALFKKHNIIVGFDPEYVKIRDTFFPSMLAPRDVNARAMADSVFKDNGKKAAVATLLKLHAALKDKNALGF